MSSRLSGLAVLAGALLVGCSSNADIAAQPVATPSATVTFDGPSGLEVESEQAAHAALDAQRVETERLAAEAAAEQAAAEAAEQAAAEQAAVEEAAARRAAEDAAAAEQAAEEAAAAQTFDEAEDGYESSDLEVRCSDGTATVEECFGPGSDLDENGVADVNE